MAVALSRRRFSTDEYHRMTKVGILDEDDRIALIDGEIIEMAPVGERHNAGVLRVGDIFYGRWGRRALVSARGPIHLGEKSEPQPDVVLLHRRPEYDQSSPPQPSDVFLLVEVADSSLEYDRQVKAGHYARGGVQELWIVNLEQDLLLVYRDPSAEDYLTVQVARRGETVAPLAFPDVVFPVSDLLGS